MGQILIRWHKKVKDVKCYIAISCWAIQRIQSINIYCKAHSNILLCCLLNLLSVVFVYKLLHRFIYKYSRCVFHSTHGGIGVAKVYKPTAADIA